MTQTTKARAKGEETLLEPIRFPRGGISDGRFDVAVALHQGTRDGLLERIPELEAAIALANRATDARTVVHDERETISSELGIEESEAEAAFAALRAGDDPGLTERAQRVADLIERAGVLDSSLRIGESVVRLSVSAALAEIPVEPVLRVLSAAVARLFAEAVEAVEGFPVGVPLEEIMRTGGSAVEASQRFAVSAAGYSRVREIFDRFVNIAGYGDSIGGRPGRVHAESTDPLAAEQFATPPGREVRDPRYSPSLLWPDEADPTVRAAATRRRLEAFARSGVAPWCPSPDELRRALEKGGVEKPTEPQVPAWVGSTGSP